MFNSCPKWGLDGIVQAARKEDECFNLGYTILAAASLITEFAKICVLYEQCCKIENQIDLQNWA
jgi:hypothetical protein